MKKKQLYVFNELVGSFSESYYQPGSHRKPINIRRGNKAAHFEPTMNANSILVAPPPAKRSAIGGCPIVAFYDMLRGQFEEEGQSSG